MGRVPSRTAPRDEQEGKMPLSMGRAPSLKSLLGKEKHPRPVFFHLGDPPGLLQVETLQSVESATVMTSSGQSQNKINSERATANTRSVEIESRCTYPNERRERNQIYTLLNISNDVNEHEERSLECVNGTGWEDAVQGWSKTAPFAYLQLQKRARRTRTSESVGGCLYCLDMIQVPDKCLEQDPKTIDQLKSDFKLSSDSLPKKPETLLSSCTPVNPSSATEDTKKESCYGKVCSTQTVQGEKKKTPLKEAQASVSERKSFILKDSQLFQGEKKTVPIREYNILPPSKPKSLETLKCKDTKSQESSVCHLVSSETTPIKPSLPPLKESTLKSSLDSSSKKSKTVLFQAREKTCCAVSETVSRAQVFKSQHRCDKEIGIMGNAVKEPVKMHEIPSSVPKLSKTSFLSRNSDRCYWRCAFLPSKKLATVPSWIALRRNSHLNSMHCLHMKGDRGSQAHETQEPCARSRSYSGTTLGNEPKTQGNPLLSGLFPSLTEHSWGRATPLVCFKNPKNPKKRISKMVSNFTHQNVMSTPKESMAWITHLAQDPTRPDWTFQEETISSNKKFLICGLNPYGYIPMTTTSAEEKRARGRIDPIQTYLSDKRTLPVKEYENKSLPKCPEPQALQCKKIGLPKVTHSDPPSSFSCVTLNALLVFRPDKRGVINVHLEPPPKMTEAKMTKVMTVEKGSNPSTRSASYIRATKKVKPKGGKKVGRMNITKKQIKKSCNTR